MCVYGGLLAVVSMPRLMRCLTSSYATMLHSTRTFIDGVSLFIVTSTRPSFYLSPPRPHRRRSVRGHRRLPSPNAVFAVSGPRRPAAVGGAVAAAVIASTRRPGPRRSAVRRHTTVSRRKRTSSCLPPSTTLGRRSTTNVDTTPSLPNYFQSTVAVAPPPYRLYVCERRLRPTHNNNGINNRRGV